MAPPNEQIVISLVLAHALAALILTLVGGFFAPLRFFRDSQNLAACSAAKFCIPVWSSIPHLLCKFGPQVISGHLKLGHKVTLSDLT